MADQLPPRVSALAAHYTPVANTNAGVTLTEVPDLSLWQVATWADSLGGLSQSVAAELGISSVPGFGQAQTNGTVSMLRIEPLKFWVVGAALSEVQDGAVLDLSHSRTHVRLSGEKATTVLNSYLPLDLRARSFPVGSVASSAFHHVGVTLWHSEHGYELFIPRGFAVSLWESLIEAAEQYQLAIV